MNSKKKITSAVAQDKGVISAKNAEFATNSYIKSPQDEFAVKIGIVIPIYNVAPYLRECLDSVINQTYGNFCAVLVNDGSTDNSKEIALEYVAKDSRFVLIDKENGGLSSARNAGIDYFNGAIESSLLDSTNHTILPSLQDSTNLAPLSSLRGEAEAIQANNKIDCHESADADFCNNESFLDCHDFATQNLVMTGERDSSLRESRSDSKQSKQNNLHEVKAESYKKYIDCFGQSPRNDKITIHTNATHWTPPQIDYIIFLDSDDFWELDLLEKCVDSAQIAHESNANPDIIWFDWNEIYEVSGKIQGKTTMELFGFAKQTQISAMQWLQRAKEREILQFWWAWKGLICFDYLRRVNLRFLEGVIFEDNLFGILLFSQCESIAILPRRLYNYRIRSGSTTNSIKSLPPFVAPLRAHFSAEGEAWDYFCAYSLCEMSLVFVDFCANLSDKNLSKLCESAFLPNFLAESCDILAFSSDPLNAKSRFIALLKKRGKDSPYLKIIAHIIPKRLKRLRFGLFLFYFAPKVAFFRTTRKILKVLRICRG